MQDPITQDQIISFILNNVNKNERKKIIKAINSNEITKKVYLLEKRKYDIERYLNNEMSIGERIELEDLLKNNKSLNEHFMLSKKINGSLKLKKLMDLLDNIHAGLYDLKPVKDKDTTDIMLSIIKGNTHLKKRNPQIMQIGKWVAVASIVIAIISTGLFGSLLNRDNFEGRPYQEYYKSPITNNNAYFFKTSQFNRAKEIFFEKDYEGALIALEGLSKSGHTEQQEVLLFSGLTLMEMDRHKEAIEKFECLLSGNEDLKIIGSITNWYLGLCYIKTNQYPQAKKQFEIIVKYKGYNYKEAKKVLKRLKRQQD